MKNSLIIVFGVLLCTGGCAPVVYEPAGPQPGYVVAVEDRPYYVHGPYYIENGRRWVWVTGHWGRHHGRRFWVHGHYVLRG